MDVVSNNRGYLFLIGGAEDRNGDKRVLKKIVSQIQPKNIVIIPTASWYPRDIDRCYSSTFMDLGIQGTDCLDIRYPDEADRGSYLDAIERADLIYFGGGDQAKLVETLIRTRSFNLIRKRFEAGQLHIAGTSAGASAAGNPIFYDGDQRGFEKGSINTSEGFGFIDDVAVDTHFSERNRLPRLCQFLISGQCQKGIGLDEDTGIMIDHNLHFTVFGSGFVTVVNSTHVTGSNYTDSEYGDSLKFNNMRVGVLSPGSTFSIRKWSILKKDSKHLGRTTS